MRVDPSVIGVLADYFWAFAVGACTLVGSLSAIIWRMVNAKIEDNHKYLNAKIDAVKTEFYRRIDDTDAAASVSRRQIEKLVDKLDEHAQRREDLHRELLTAIHEGLAKKADK